MAANWKNRTNSPSDSAESVATIMHCPGFAQLLDHIYFFSSSAFRLQQCHRFFANWPLNTPHWVITAPVAITCLSLSWELSYLHVLISGLNNRWWEKSIESFSKKNAKKWAAFCSFTFRSAGFPAFCMKNANSHSPINGRNAYVDSLWPICVWHHLQLGIEVMNQKLPRKLKKWCNNMRGWLLHLNTLILPAFRHINIHLNGNCIILNLHYYY